MRLLNKNKRVVCFRNYVGKSEKTDEFGRKTGQYEVTYDDAKIIRANVSAGVGEPWRTTIGQEEYGIASTEIRTMVTPVTCEITEASIVWLLQYVPPLYDERRAYRYKQGDILIADGMVTRASKDNPSRAELVPMPHNFIVTKVSKSLNSALYTLQEVNKS